MGLLARRGLQDGACRAPRLRRVLGLEQFEDEAFGWRLVFYPLAAVLVPLVSWLAGRPPLSPYALDILLVSFLVDVAGNALDLCDSEELDTAYTDTLGDMILGLAGATAAGILTATVLARRD